MSNTEQVALSWWQKPQVQSLIQSACGSSGLIGAALMKICHHYGLPVPDVGVTTMFVSGAITLLIQGTFSWWHDHPNNLARRLIRQLNGDGISQDQKTAIATALPDKDKIAAAAAVPGVQEVIVSAGATDGAKAAVDDPALSNVTKGS